MANVVKESNKRIPAHASQCFLVENLDRYALKKGTSLVQDYKNLALIDPAEDDSTVFLNKIRGMGEPGQRLFENLPKTIAGDLQPYVKLYKVIPFKSGQTNPFKDIAVHLPFNNLNFDPSAITARGVNKKLGVAFRSFSFDFEGKRPVEVDASVTCNLRLFFESPDALTAVYGTSPKTVSFADLISRPYLVNNTTHDHLEYDEKHFRIKVVVGYHPPSLDRLVEAYRLARVDNPKEQALALITALRSSRFELYLTLLKHTITPKFDSPDGGYDLSIEYVGSIETAFRSKNADILAHPLDKKRIAKQREWEIKIARYRQEAFSGLGDVTRAEIEAIAGAGDFTEQYEKEYKNQRELAAEKANEENQKGALTRAGFGMLTGMFTDAARTSGGGAAGLGKSAEVRANDSAIKEKVASKMLEDSKIELNESKLAAVTKYLEWKDNFAQEKANSLNSTLRLADIYSRIITRLNQKNKLYVSKLRNSDFENWFLHFDKAKKEDTASMENKIEKLTKKLSKAKNSSEKKRLQEEIDDLKAVTEDRSNMDAMYKSIAKRATENITTSKATGEAAEKSKAAVKEAAKNASKSIKDKEKEAKDEKEPENSDQDAKKTAAASIDDHDIYFFYYGDLLDTVLEVMSEMKSFLDLNFWSQSNKGGNIKLLLGEIEFPHPSTGKRVKENLAKIPITLETWQRFWVNKVITPVKTEYLFRSFLNDTTSELIVDALTNKCKRLGSPMIVVRTGIHYETLQNNASLKFRQKVHMNMLNDRAYYHSYEYDAAASDPDEELDNEKAAVRTELIYVHAPSQSSRWYDPRDKKADLRRGVHHIVLGAENSPIIAANFDKSNQPYYLEAKAETGGVLDDTIHFSEPYNCSITMYGNSIIIPGKHLHISFPHSHFGRPYSKRSAARRLGLGGYFFILITKNEIKASEARLEWTTQLNCKWESFGAEDSKPRKMYSEQIELRTDDPANDLAHGRQAGYDHLPGARIIETRDQADISVVPASQAGQDGSLRKEQEYQRTLEQSGPLKDKDLSTAGRDILGKEFRIRQMKKNLEKMGYSESELAWFNAKLAKGQEVNINEAPTESQMMQEPESAAALQAEMGET